MRLVPGVVVGGQVLKVDAVDIGEVSNAVV
jgi:hypothetical protein